MKSNICLVVLCGIPASGKSTLSQKLQYYFSTDDNVNQSKHAATQRACHNKANMDLDAKKFICVAVSYDEFIPEGLEKRLIEQEDHSRWKSHRDHLHRCVDEVLSMFLEYVKVESHHTDDNSCEVKVSKQSEPTVASGVMSGYVEELCRKFKVKIVDPLKRELLLRCGDENLVVIIDDNMYYSSMRYKYYQLARKYSCGYCQVHLDLDLEKALTWNRSRTRRKIPEDVIIAMANKLERPDHLQNTWEKHSLTLKPDEFIETHGNSSMEQVVEMIKAAMNDPVPPLPESDWEGMEESRRICSENVVHQADQIIRKLIGQTMAQAKDKKSSKELLRSLSKQAMDVKFDLLSNLRSGALYIDVETEGQINYAKMSEKLKDLFHQKIS